MKKNTITPTLLNEDLSFSPIKYFVSKKSVYPSTVVFHFEHRINIDELYGRLMDKFDGYNTFFRKNSNGKYYNFCLIHDDKDSVIFYYDGSVLYYYSNEIDVGLIQVVNEIIKSCYE